MASQEIISLVVDKIVAAFSGDVGLFESWLLRSKLGAELLALESEARNLQAVEDAQNAEYLAAIVAKNEEIAAKQSEIDAL